MKFLLRENQVLLLPQHAQLRPARLLNVLCTFNLRPVSTGMLQNNNCILHQLRTKVFRFCRKCRRHCQLGQKLKYSCFRKCE